MPKINESQQAGIIDTRKILTMHGNEAELLASIVIII